MSSKRIIFFIVFSWIMTGCQTMIPSVAKPNSKPVFHQDRNAVKIANKLDAKNAETIYLSIERAVNQAGGGQDVLPSNLMMVSVGTASTFRPTVQVINNAKGTLKRIFKDPETNKRLYDVDIAIIDYIEGESSSSFGVDFGVEFGDGKGKTFGNGNPFRDSDTISKIRVQMLFNQSGFVMAKRVGTIGIGESTRGYYYGLRVNGSGFGIAASNTKKEGIGEAIEKLLHTMYGDIFEQISVYRKANKPESTMHISNNDFRKKKSDYREPKKEIVHESRTKTEVLYREPIKRKENRSYIDVNPNIPDDNSELDSLL